MSAEDDERHHPLLDFWRPGVHPSTPVPWATLKGSDSILWPPPDEPRERSSVVEVSRDQPDWRTVIELWNHRAKMTSVESGHVLGWLRDEAPEPIGPRESMEVIGRDPSEVWYSTLLETLELPDTLRARLDADDLSLRTIRYLRELPESWKRPIYREMAEERFRLSVQEFRQLVEASHRWTGEEEEWLDLFHQTTADNPKERGKQFLERIRRRVYPTLHEQRESFEEDLRELDVSGRIRVSPPKNFEGDYLDFSLRCGRNDSLPELAEELKKCEPLLEHV